MSKNKQTYFPDEPVHPGVSLAADLEFLSLSVKELAMRTGVSQKHLSNIINGRALISPDMAIRLEKVTGNKASYWDNLSRNYEASLSRLEERKHLEAEAEHIEDYKETYAELARYGIVAKFRWVESNFLDITRELLKFFSTYSLQYVPSTQAAAFRRYQQKINPRTVAAVIRLGERKAQAVDTEEFNESALKKALPEIKSYSLLEQEEYLPKLEEKLRTLGIVLVCVPGFAHTGLQGAAEWLDPKKAMIILKAESQSSTTKFYEDQFWFNLFHELGHLLLHSRKQTFIDLDSSANSEEELEANAFAIKQLLGDFKLSDLDAYIVDGAVDAKKAIPGIAKEQSVAKSIVAGCMAYMYKDIQENVYAVLNDYKKPLRYTNYQI